LRFSFVPSCHGECGRKGKKTNRQAGLTHGFGGALADHDLRHAMSELSTIVCLVFGLSGE
jgi:hypothetical protein